MSGESEVRLLREFIRVRFSPRLASTTVQFEFCNEGPAQTVTMGFPEQVVYKRSSYRRFRTELDGHPLRARRTRWTEESPQTLWARWWISKVHFARGQRRVLRVHYQERPAFSDELGYRYRYILGTGGAWKGSIGSVSALISLENFPPESTIWMEESGVTRRGKRLALRFRDWNPEEEESLDMEVLPRIAKLNFCGVRPDPALDVNLRRGRLDGYLTELLFWTKGMVVWLPNEKSALVSRNSKSLLLKVGSRKALLLPQKWELRLPFSPYLEKEGLRVPFGAVCEALGLRVQTSKDAIGNWNVSVSGEQTPSPGNGDTGKRAIRVDRPEPK